MGEHNLNLQQSNGRIAHIDIAKGLLIILVIIGHITNVTHIVMYGMKAVITTFHMPAFFIITGTLSNVDKLQHTSFKEFLIRKSYRLLLPYVFFEITGGLWQMLFLGVDAVNLTGILYGIFTIHCHVGADWFLPTIFFAEVCLFFLLKTCPKKAYPFIIVLCFLIAFVLPDLTYLIACCRRILIALAFILIGVCFKACFMKRNLFALIASAIITITIAYFNGVVDLATRQFGNPILYILGSIVGTYCVLCFSQYLSGMPARLLSRVGKSTLVIMGTHQNVQVAFNFHFGSVYSLPLQIIVFITTFVYEIVTVVIYEKYIPFFIGANRKNILFKRQKDTVQ